jgi:arylsulfatase
MQRPSRRNFLAAAAAPAIFAAPHGTARRPPNVIVLLTDDQGYGDFSCHGNPVLKTPNMDRLHAQSVRFTDFHSAPMCTPTRGQLLTGMDALRNRATSVTAGRAVVQRGIPMMPEMFAAAGYSTGVFGKWHVGDAYPYRPMDRGFQEAKYFYGWGLNSAPEFSNDYFNGLYCDRGARKRFPGYCTDFWFDEAMSWMKARAARSEPFLCYLPTNTPHGPAWVDKKYSAPYQRPGVPAAFFGMIANLDENLGRLEKFLAANNLTENTVLVFMTDNGGTGGVNLFNAGMRGRKTQYYDGGHRVPCFVRWPAGGFGAPRDVATPAGMQDILPTILDLCGVKPAANARFDGTSLAGLLRSPAGKLADRMIVVQYGQILKKWDSCVIWDKWRLVGENELYDLREDFAQKNNIAAANPDVLKRMRGHYEQWWDGVKHTLTEYCPLSIGAEQENPVTLTSSDWQDIYCDNTNNILAAAGGPQGGEWNLQVERAGQYEISLSRWPRERAMALDAPCPPQKMAFGDLPAGKAVPIAGAKLTVAGQQFAAKSKPGDQAILFRATLEAGRTKMHGWFQDAQGADLCGAFYAHVRRV